MCDYPVYNIVSVGRSLMACIIRQRCLLQRLRRIIEYSIITFNARFLTARVGARRRNRNQRLDLPRDAR